VHQTTPRIAALAAALLCALLAGAALLAGPLAGVAAAQDEAVRAQVFSGRGQDRENYAGVGVLVLDADGAEVGSGETDAEGVAEIPVPGPGTYTVSVDEATLPEGFGPGETAERAVQVRAGRAGNALFALEEGGAAAAGGALLDRLSSVPQLLVLGIRFGAIIAITSIGLSLVFGTTGLVNFAHGELVTLGAVIAFLLNAASVAWLPEIQLIPAALVAIALGALAGIAMERGLWRPMRRRGIGLISMLVVSIGLSLLLRNVLQLFFGGNTRPYNDYSIQSAVTLGPLRLTPRDIAITLLSFLVLILIGLMLQRTRIGKAMRAVADNRDLAESSGIDVDRVVVFVWGLAGGLAALGGVFQSTAQGVNVNFGFQLLLLMFAGIILGGIGTAYGAVVGSLVVGIVIEVSTVVLPADIKNASGLLVLILVLLVRPQGILGRAERFG
jgi:neutral amino acid transport system permease protein